MYNYRLIKDLVHLQQGTIINLNLLFLIFILLTYLLGSLNSAIIICRVLNLPSPRSIGSGNPGATNIFRLTNKFSITIYTFLGDCIKSIIPIVIGQYFNLNDTMLWYIGLTAVLGHIFPIFWKFKGGKGVATCLGTLLALNYILGIIFILTWIFILILFNYSSLASIIAIFFTLIFAIFFKLYIYYLIPLTFLFSIIFLRHYKNIKKIFSGKENKLLNKNKI